MRPINPASLPSFIAHQRIRGRLTVAVSRLRPTSMLSRDGSTSVRALKVHAPLSGGVKLEEELLSIGVSSEGRGDGAVLLFAGSSVSAVEGLVCSRKLSAFGVAGVNAKLGDEFRIGSFAAERGREERLRR